MKVKEKQHNGKATLPVSGAARAVAAEELDPGRERRPLESYFQEIGGTRTLRREEEVLLANRFSYLDVSAIVTQLVDQRKPTIIRPAF